MLAELGIVWHWLGGSAIDNLDPLVALVGFFPNLVNITGMLTISHMDRLQTLEGAFPALEYSTWTPSTSTPTPRW